MPKTIHRAQKSFIITVDVSAFFYDFDGVMTDNKVLVFSNGTEAVRCHRGDGWAVARLRARGYRQCIISTEENVVVRRRARKLKIPCIQGISDKRRALLAYAKKNGIDLKRSVYVGNDVNDLAAMMLVGVRIAPSDATAPVLAVADLVTTARGGEGVIRELLNFFPDKAH